MRRTGRPSTRPTSWTSIAGNSRTTGRTDRRPRRPLGPWSVSTGASVDSVGERPWPDDPTTTLATILTAARTFAPFCRYDEGVCFLAYVALKCIVDQWSHIGQCVSDRTVCIILTTPDPPATTREHVKQQVDKVERVSHLLKDLLGSREAYQPCDEVLTLFRKVGQMISELAVVGDAASQSAYRRLADRT